MKNEIYYIAGYFYADGSLNHPPYNYPSIEIIKEDGLSLQQVLINANINFTSRERIRKNSTKSQLCLTIKSSDPFIDYFRKIMYNKISLLQPLMLIPENKQYLFFRGFFDGDGCISLNKNGGARLYFYGHYNQYWQPLMDILTDLNIKYTYQQINRKNNTHLSSHLYISNKPGINTLFQYLYPSQKYDFGLSRKYIKMLSVSNSIKRQYFSTKHRKADAIKLY